METEMINVTFKFVKAEKAKIATFVGLRGDDPQVLDGMEWFVPAAPHPDQPEGCVTLQHWCSGSYRWLDKSALDAALAAS